MGNATTEVVGRTEVVSRFGGHTTLLEQPNAMPPPKWCAPGRAQNGAMLSGTHHFCRGPEGHYIDNVTAATEVVCPQVEVVCPQVGH